MSSTCILLFQKVKEELKNRSIDGRERRELREGKMFEDRRDTTEEELCVDVCTE